ncbi:MAG TPA: Rpp14/Pop5 family protein [Candidatus Thermoplasmatota archaeon]|nr:Rpp14/Pop5 family protein [Candidatus Thermoplasmatota archaeon]
MVVKDRVGRPRYVAFRVEAPVAPTRGEMVAALRGLAAARYGKDAADRMGLRLILYDGREGAVRVLHTHRDAAVAILEGITWAGKRENPTRVTPLGTSGTLRAARDRYLSMKREPRRARGAASRGQTDRANEKL